MAEAIASDNLSRYQRIGLFSQMRQGLSPWWFLLPAVIFFVGYQAYPIFRVLWISFTDYQYLSQDPPKWVGLQNYAEALSDEIVIDHTELTDVRWFTRDQIRNHAEHGFTVPRNDSIARRLIEDWVAAE